MSDRPADDAFALDPRAVARSFGAASVSYDDNAALQTRVRNELLERLDELALQPAAVLDLGAGTGHGSRELKRRFPKAHVVACDIAPAMLVEARKQQRLWRRFDRVAADAYRLPFQDAAFDLVFSSLMFQWCDDLMTAFGEAGRVLKPSGRLLLSTFGPDTLFELRLAWAEAGDPYSHVNRFLDLHDVGDQLVRAGFGEPVLDVERVRVDYDDVRSLLHTLKAIGAHNVTAGRSRGLTGPGRFKAMTAAYERFRREGRLPATYEVIFASAWGTERRRARSRSSDALASPEDREVRIPPESIPIRRRRDEV